MIEAFGFNTKQGKTVQLYNTTVEEIKEHLIKVFPNFKPEAIHKIATNENFYVVVKPQQQEKKVKRPIKSKETLSILGCQFNDILKLALSVHCYKKNCYRYWGIKTYKIFNNPNIAVRYNDFEEKYTKLNKLIKASATKNELVNAIDEMCDKLVLFKKSVEKSGILESEKNEDYINSTKLNGRRMGLQKIIDKIGELVGSVED